MTGTGRNSRWAWLAAAVATIGGPTLGADDRPNVVLIVADDLGWADLGGHRRRDLLRSAIAALAACMPGMPQTPPPA